MDAMTWEMNSANGDPVALRPRGQLRRLFVLRNFAIAGVIAAVLLAWDAFDVALPFKTLSYVIAVIVLINALTWIRLRQSWLVTDQELFVQLLLDVLGLGVLLYLTGGSTNPFVSLLLIPVILAATLLPARYSWLMAGLTVLCYTLLLYWYIPLGGGMSQMEGMISHDQLSPGFRLHIVGMWFNFVISAALIATVAVRMMESIRSRDRQLAEAREETLRNERIIAVGTMAAGAAHELGTPLSTIAVICKELQLEHSDDQQLADNLQTVRMQVDQCKHILSTLLANAGNARPVAGTILPLDKQLERILDKWLLVRPNITVNFLNKGQQPAPEIELDQTLDQALMNLFNNAADASPDDVEVELTWTAQHATITIRDRGPGLSDEALRNAGKAFFTTKSPDHGLGIGLYLANATIERFGGEVCWFDRDGGGAITQVTLPLNTPRRGSP
jgi:two-component system sensor histidine kinase RegB